ncbi:MFS transporter [Curtobacterium flaccumfaciens]|nr:MFS transporter [Curtobacterium flaccumfaciens]
MGAEAGIGNSYLGESAPEGKRGQIVSYANAATFIAMLFGTLLAAAMTWALGAETMAAWGWRIPFLIAFPLGIAALWVRMRADESPEFTKVETAGITVANPLAEAFRSRSARRGMFLTIALPLLNSSGYFVLFTYMPSFMSNYLHFTLVQSLVVTGVALAVGTLTALIAGRMSDRIGRKPMLIGSAGLMVLLGFPCYWLITLGSLPLAVVASVVMAVVFTGTNGVMQVTLLELFPTRIRTVAYGFGYNIGTAIFGGAARP